MRKAKGRDVANRSDFWVISQNMFDNNSIFSDVFAHIKNIVTGIEVRTKIVFIAIALLINLLSPNIYTPIAIAIFCLATLIVIKIPPKLLMLRLSMPLVMAVMVLAVQMFVCGTIPLFTIPLWGFHLVGYKEGLTHGLLIMCRVIAGISLVLFMSMSTPANKLFQAAIWFRVNRIFVEIALLMYRYIFVLAEEAIAMKEAQKVRFGYHNWKQSIRSLGMLGGTLILRAYDRAERVFEAMLTRGYTGTAIIRYQSRLSNGDIISIICLGLLLIVFFLISRL
ncbi:MAG: cobalt ECF transporter T component CbiQ [Actinobacteria bacterium]|nr:cobalt ECF transporter T component CbiQ [Actinomycetota bacterium]